MYSDDDDWVDEWNDTDITDTKHYWNGHLKNQKISLGPAEEYVYSGGIEVLSNGYVKHQRIMK